MPSLTTAAKVTVLSIAIFPALSSASDFDSILSMDCSKLESLLPNNQSEKEEVDRFVGYEPSQSVLRYLTGDDSLFGEYYENLLERRYVVSGLKVNDLPKALKEQVNEPHQLEYIRSMRRYIEKQEKPLAKRYWDKSNPWRTYAVKASICRHKDLASNEGSEQNAKIQSVVSDSKSKFREGRVGFFDVKINSCGTQELPITYNKHTEPKTWEGSRFIVINTVFKNQDSEGRLPSAGSLIINYQGRELRYDTTETIMQEGYGIYFKSVNPLVTMPTKIVYRIPSEVSGEVSWEPGRNAEGKRLWCTFVNAENQ